MVGSTGQGRSFLDRRREGVKEFWILFGIVLSALGTRFTYLFHLLPICRADEAVFGLMTEHFLEGKGFPIYLYGAHYAGALICYLAAPLFFLFGASMPLLKLTTYFFMFPTLLMIYFLTRSLTDSRTAALAALFFAVPPFLINWTGQYAGGGYPETLFFGTAVLFLTHRFLSEKMTSAQEIRRMKLLGFLNGVGTWILFSIIPYTLTAWTLIFFKKTREPLRRLFAVFSSFYAIGLLPMVIYNIQRPFATFMRLGANVMDVERSEIAGKESGELFRLAFSKIGARLLGFPKEFFQVIQNIWEMMRMDRSLGSLATVWDVLLAASLGILFLTILFSIRKNFMKHPLSLPFLLVAWMILFLAATGLTKTRYVAFMYPALAVLFASTIFQVATKRWLGISIASVLLSANLLNHGVALKTPETEDRFGELVQFLEKKGLRYGYTDYVTAYPIVFLTRERIIASPAAGPLNVERFPAYTEKVNQAEDLFFVFEGNSEASKRFEASLKSRRVSFKRGDVLDRSVYYDFSKRVAPRELPLIRFFPPD